MNARHIELHKRYKQAVELYLKNFEADYIDDRHLDAYYRDLALQLWKIADIELPVCKQGLEEIYTTRKKVYTRKEIEKQLDEQLFPVFVPAFFSDIVQRDVKNGTAYSRRFASLTNQLLLMFSLIDDKTQESERAFIQGCVQALNFTCDLENISKDESKPAKKKQTAVHDEETSAGKVQITDDRPLKSIDDLNSLIGLNNVKKEIIETTNFVAYQQKLKEMGIPTNAISRHLVFSGNPGTGKTEVARILADIYKGNGVLSKGQLVEVSRSDLVAGYVGQTAERTAQILDKAIGGILFIDEAYTLSQGGKNDFGQEAIDTIIRYMEDKRDDLIVIAAGYDEQMKTFISSNPGLQSRFKKIIHFDDYSVDELYEIFVLMCQKQPIRFDPALEDKIKNEIALRKEKAGANFGNGRDVRKYVEEIAIHMASRLSNMDMNEQSLDELITAIEDDFGFHQ